MISFDVMIEVIAFGISALICSIILLIETISWCSGHQVEQSNNNQHQLQLDIDGIDNTKTNSANSNSSTASSPSTDSCDPFMRLRISTMITYISYICYSTSAILSKLGIGLKCDKSVALPSFFYMISKSCLYLVLLYRIYFVYKNSVFQRSTKMLQAAAVFIVLWGLFISISNVMLLNVEAIDNSDGSIHCKQTSNPLLVLLFIVVDFIVNVGCCYSFTRPLFWLSKMTHDAKNASMYNVVTKYVILTVVTVASTFLCLIPLVLIGIQWPPAVDVVVNSVCIMLLDKKYHRYYQYLCCGAHKIGHRVIQMECCYGQKANDVSSK